MNFFSYVSLLQRGLSLLRLIELRLFFALMAFTDPFQYLNHSTIFLASIGSYSTQLIIPTAAIRRWVLWRIEILPFIRSRPVRDPGKPT
jgi:hypothetical protein